MKTVKIVPGICEGADAKYSGTVTLRVPSFDEHCEFVEMLEMSRAKAKDSPDVPLEVLKLQSIRKMVKHSKDYYQEVDIVHVESGKKYASFDDLQYDQSVWSVLGDVASKFVEGIQVGNA